MTASHNKPAANFHLHPQDLLILALILSLGLFAFAAWIKAPIVPSVVFIIGISMALGFYIYTIRNRADEPLIDTPNPISEERTIAQQALLADGFAEAVLMIDRQEQVIYANPSALTLFDMDKAAGALSNLVENTDVKGLAKKVLSGERPDPVVFHLDTPVERHFRVMGSPVKNEHGQTSVKRAIIVFYDITDIERVNTMRADFLANASHELKTPVASLLGYIETLRGHARDDDKAREMFLGIMQQQAERMQRLIDDLLSLRRIEIVEHLVPTETADLYLATRAAIEAAKPIAKKKGVKIKYNGPKEVLVKGAQDELVQLALNIIDNGISITPEGESVLVHVEQVENISADKVYSDNPEFEDATRRSIVETTELNGPLAILRIQDKGIGFDPEHIPRIGERFYKAGDRKRGTGLGLAIVKHIMRRHRGGLFVESKKGVGTIFTILLPLTTDM